MLFLFLILLTLQLPCQGFSSLQNSYDDAYNKAFSLSSYRKARAKETSRSLDASRFHFQILFVDDNNSHGRIVEGVMARVAEYNDAMFILFPASATIDSISNAPQDAAAPKEAIHICESLGLCSTSSTAMGTSFTLDNLNEYDLVVSMNEEVQNLILRSLSDEEQILYEPKCRILSEFLSLDFCNFHRKEGSNTSNFKKSGNDNLLLDMLDSELYERAAPFSDLSKDSSSSILCRSTITWTDLEEPRIILSDTGAAIPNTNGWPQKEAVILLASAGITRFCLDTMDFQMEMAFQQLLERHFNCEGDLDYNFDRADAQLRRGSFGITGYFSPKQRQTKFEQHLESLRLRMGEKQ